MKKEQVSLNKYISSSGFCSRREADKLIDQARVTINGEIIMSAIAVYPGDVVEIDGEPIRKTKQRPIYLAMNKPVGVTSTTDPKDRSNIIYFINHTKRIFPVGRLDKDSDGLIFLTNDGDIVNKILRASNHHEKEYIVNVDKAVTPDFIKQMSNGIPMLGTVTKKCFVRQEGSRRFRIILTQGLNRQIRRMCEHLEYKVVSLTRVRIMNVELGNLPVGKWRYLTLPEVDKLNEMVAESSKTDNSSSKSKVAHKAEAAKVAVQLKKETKDAEAAKAGKKQAVVKKTDEQQLAEWIENSSAPSRKKSTYAEFRNGKKNKNKDIYADKPKRRKGDATASGNKAVTPGKRKGPGSSAKPKGNKEFAPTQTQNVKQYIPKKKSRK